MQPTMPPRAPLRMNSTPRPPKSDGSESLMANERHGSESDSSHSPKANERHGSEKAQLSQSDPVASITSGIEATSVSKYSDRFKQPVKEPKSAVDAKSFTDFPALGKNKVIAAAVPSVPWAQTVKAAMAAEAKEQEALELIRLAKEKEKEEDHMPRVVRPYEVRGEEKYMYEDAEDEDEADEDANADDGYGTPLYGNRGFDEED